MDLHRANKYVEHREEVKDSNQHPFLIVSASIGSWVEETNQPLEDRQLGIFVTVVDDHEENEEVKQNPEH